MEKEKVYCKNCEYLREIEDEEYICRHESNEKKRVDWYSETRIQIRPPKEINMSNDCRNYSPHPEED